MGAILTVTGTSDNSMALSAGEPQGHSDKSHELCGSGTVWHGVQERPDAMPQLAGPSSPGLGQLADVKGQRRYHSSLENGGLPLGAAQGGETGVSGLAEGDVDVTGGRRGGGPFP